MIWVAVLAFAGLIVIAVTVAIGNARAQSGSLLAHVEAPPTHVHLVPPEDPR